MNALRQLSAMWRPRPGANTYEDSIDCGNSGDIYDAGYNDASKARANELDKLAPVIEAMAEALRAIANRAGAPTMSYAPEIERREQRESLDWIAAKCAEVLATFEKESADGS